MSFLTYLKEKGVKRAVQVLYQYKIQLVLNKAMLLVTKKMPLKDIILIESHNDFDCNGGAFYNYLLKEGYHKKYKIVWMLRNKTSQALPKNVSACYIFRPSIRKAYYLCMAKYMTSDHYAMGRMRPDQVACYLGHGAIGLKAVKGKLTLPEALNCIPAPSEFLIPTLAHQRSLPYPNDKQVVLGFPVHDLFYDDTQGDLRKITGKKYAKVILWMPTFRKSVDFDRNDSSAQLPLGVPILRDEQSCRALNVFLAEHNTLLILKLHPMQDLSTVKIKALSNIVILDGNTVKKLGVDNYRLMKDADALISDYSSAAYDFLHRQKPLAFTLDDATDYKLGFLFENPLDYMPGHKIYNQSDFFAFIEDVIQGKDPYQKERAKIFDLFFKYHDGKSSERLAAFLGLSR